MYTAITYQQMHDTALMDLDTIMESHEEEGAPVSCYQAAQECLDEYDHGTVDLVPDTLTPDADDEVEDEFTYRFARQLYVTACMQIAHYAHGEEWDTEQINALFTIA